MGIGIRPLMDAGKGSDVKPTTTNSCQTPNNPNQWLQQLQQQQSQQQKGLKRVETVCLLLDVGAFAVDVGTLFFEPLAPLAVSLSGHALACNGFLYFSK
jgi:hypothetical protein